MSHVNQGDLKTRIRAGMGAVCVVAALSGVQDIAEENQQRLESTYNVFDDKHVMATTNLRPNNNNVKIVYGIRTGFMVDIGKLSRGGYSTTKEFFDQLDPKKGEAAFQVALGIDSTIGIKLQQDYFENAMKLVPEGAKLVLIDDSTGAVGVPPSQYWDRIDAYEVVAPDMGKRVLSLEIGWYMSLFGMPSTDEFMDKYGPFLQYMQQNHKPVRLNLWENDPNKDNGAIKRIMEFYGVKVRYIGKYPQSLDNDTLDILAGKK